MIAATAEHHTGIQPCRLFFEPCEHSNSHPTMAPASPQELPQTLPFSLPDEKPTSQSLDILTTSTDDLSLSSLSSMEDDTFDNDSFSELPPAKPRSIFHSYWSKEKPARSLSSPPRFSYPEQRVVVAGRIPLSVSRGDSAGDSDDESTSSSCISYERTLRKNEGIRSPAKTPEATTPHRRSIFGNSHYISQSMPSLGEHLTTTRRENYRKTRSASDFEGKLPSCLRSNRRRERSNSTVSFSSQVTVMEFKDSQEAWAADGWSKYFY